MPPSAPLLLVDGHNLLHRAWYGFAARITSRDKTDDRTGVFGFAALLRKAQGQHAQDHEVLVVFDAEDGSSTRAEQDREYKAQRPAPDPGLIASLADIKRGLDTMDVGWIEQPGVEGDDVIATLTATACTGGRVNALWTLTPRARVSPCSLVGYLGRWFMARLAVVVV
ncbi:hypothetical protein [Streptomyces marincola]|nr:hypothetical protein [Streptomyces marincola]